MDRSLPRYLVTHRSRVLWWLLLVGFLALLAGVLSAFIGTFVLGIFIYYAARPLHRRVNRWIDRPTLAALVALFLFELPFLAVDLYVLFLGLREFETISEIGTILLNRLFPTLGEELTLILAEPSRYLARLDVATIREMFQTGAGLFGDIATALLHLSLAIAIAFYLLRDGHKLEQWFRSEFDDDDPFLAYARLVDRDIQVVYHGNIRTAFIVALLGVVVYNSLNVIAPAALTIPVPMLMAVLTGAATLIPLIVGKIVYLPLVGMLALRALRIDTALMWFPAIVLIVALVVLDLFPMMVIRPYLAGRTTHSGLMLFGYVFGTLLFGWYGIFLGPMLVVMVVHFFRVGFLELVHGRAVTADVTAGASLGRPLETDPDTAAGNDGAPNPAPDSDGETDDSVGDPG
ncbi:MAG: AI-2E family transporter [Halobacteriales archaeon]